MINLACMLFDGWSKHTTSALLRDPDQAAKLANDVDKYVSDPHILNSIAWTQELDATFKSNADRYKGSV